MSKLLILIFAAGIFITGALLAIDMETAREDYLAKKKVENCIFNKVCERYSDGNM